MKLEFPARVVYIPFIKTFSVVDPILFKVTIYYVHKIILVLIRINIFSVRVALKGESFECSVEKSE